MTTVTMTADDAVRRETDDGWPQFEELIRQRVAGAAGPLFETNTDGLFDILLLNLPAEIRQHYNCNHCRRFVDDYGGLVTVDDAGRTLPVLWTPKAEVPPLFDAAWDACRGRVSAAKVTGVFVSADAMWGTPANEPGSGSKYAGRRWTHLSATNPAIYTNKLKTADQRMAELREDFGVLIRGLEEYRRDAVAEAVRVLEADALSRAEKALELGRWFLALKDVWESTRGPAKTNLIWRAVATAPPGWAHVKNTVIATLLDDIAAGMDFATVSRRWAAKMHPLQYQRPTTLKVGNLEAAEKLIEMLGAARSLERRFARLDEVVALWRPGAEEPKAEAGGGVFGHLKAKAQGASAPVRPLALPPKTLAWVRFAAEVLPGAKAIEVRVPVGPTSFYGLVTAAHADAPPILQWDGDGIVSPRNPVSWYFYHGGSLAANWGLSPMTWEPVGAISYKPPHWHTPELHAHQGWGVMVAIPKARDIRHTAGGGLFPECLLAEYREARAAIEAHSNAAAIAGKDEGDANGLCWNKGDAWAGCHLRVVGPDGSLTEYQVDRWE